MLLDYCFSRSLPRWLLLGLLVGFGLLANAARAQTPTPAPRDTTRAGALTTDTSSLRQLDSLRRTARGYPVVPHQDTLFFVYTKLGPFLPRERAALIAEKVRRLEADARYQPDSLRLYPSEQTIDLMYGELVVQSISDNDARWLNTTRDALARQYRARIVQAVAQYRQEHSLVNVLKELGLVLLVLVAFYFVVRLVNRLFGWVRAKLLTKETTWFRAVRLSNYELFTPRRGLEAALLLLTVLRWVLIFLVISLVLPLLFSIFPGTQGVADTLLGYVLDPLRRIGLALWRYLPNLVTIVVIVTVFRYLLRGLHFLKEEIRQGQLNIEGFYPDWANPTYQIVRVLVFAFLLIVIFPYLPGSDSPVFQGVSVFLGFLFTFGSAGSLSNIVAGLVLTYMRAYKLGDRVRIGDVTGDIIEKNLLVTRIRTIKNEEITIPNSSIMSSYTTNYTSAAPTLGLVLHTTVTIGYDVPWPQVHELLIAAARQAEGVLPEPAPFVLQTSLDDFYVSYQLNAYTREASRQALIYSRIHQNIQDQFTAAGVEIMSPHYRAARDGNQSTLPADYLPRDYQAPKFRVEGKE